MRVDRKCVEPTCSLNCFYSDPEGQRMLERSGWLFRPNGDALCPPHAKYLDALNYFSQFAAF